MRVVTPLTQGDCFTVSSRVHTGFDGPIHYHEEYELILILNAAGARRIIGNSIDIVKGAELVFIGPNLYHGWVNYQCQSDSIQEVIIQFHKDLFTDDLLNRNEFCLIKAMFNNARRGVNYSQEAINEVVDKCLLLSQKSQFDRVLDLLSVLHTLSKSEKYTLLSDAGFANDRYTYKSRRIENVYEYLKNNFEKDIKLTDVAYVANMSVPSFCRFLKKRTGKTFVETLNDIRLSQASRLLIDTNLNIARIAYLCGYNNLSNFNRIFKKKKLYVPKAFREIYTLKSNVYNLTR
ncbi:helix-turn-helix transcriptional regulator [Inquilinus sp. KBS0705]|nr:helix-turn-helix transcriptional regulator [Inquilinus sp. KBS0705]